MWNRICTSGHLFLVPDFRREELTHSSLHMLLAIGSFSLRVSYYILISPVFLFFFYHKLLPNFVQCFFCIYRNVYRCFFFILSTWWISLVAFECLTNSVCLDQINLVIIYYSFDIGLKDFYHLYLWVLSVYQLLTINTLVL